MNGLPNLPQVDTAMRNQTSRSAIGLAIALVLAMGTLLSTSTSSAQEVQITGPLAGQPAVRHMRVYRANRFNVAPTIGYTLQDEFARSLFIGLEANYHFLDWLGVGIWAGYNPTTIDTDLTSQIVATGQTTDRNRLSLPDHSLFSQQIGRMVWAASAHLIFIPLRGKLSLFQAVFVDTDLYILAGIAVFGVSERAATDPVGEMACQGVADGTNGMAGQSRTACIDTQRARADRVLPAPMLGVGLNLYANSWFGISFEWRAFPFSWNPSGTDESGHDQHGQAGSGFPDGHIDGQDSRTTFNHMFQLGLVFNLPPDQSVTE
jgi:outer membrane beta-barrel protein